MKLNICGSDYILVSEDSESYMHLVGEKVDEKLSEVLTKNPKLSVSMAAVLSSLEFCDEVMKTQEKFESLKSQMKKYVGENAQIQIKCKDLKLKIENCKSEVERCKVDNTAGFNPQGDIVTFSVLKNEIASDC